MFRDRIVGVIVEDSCDFGIGGLIAGIIGLIFGALFLGGVFYFWYYVFTHLSDYSFLEILPLLGLLVGVIFAAFIFDSIPAGIICSCILGIIIVYNMNSFTYPDSSICRFLEIVCYIFMFAGAGVIPSSIGYASREWLF